MALENFTLNMGTQTERNQWQEQKNVYELGPRELDFGWLIQNPVYITDKILTEVSVNVNNDDEPPTKKKRLMDGYEEEPNRRNIGTDNQSSLVDEELPCYINQLPQELLDMIFKYVTKSDRETVRLVCKLWYNSCNQKETICIEPKNIMNKLKYLENCGFKNVNVCFYNADRNVDDSFSLNSLPRMIWERIGPRIHLLELLYCRLGDVIMKNVIVFCDNLNELVVNCSSGQPFCSPEALEDLNVKRRKLNTLAIYHEGGAHDSRTWERIFKALLRIFPCVFDYKTNGATWILLDYKPKKDWTESNDLSSLVSILTSLLSGQFNSGNWTETLTTLSKIRLTSITLDISKDAYTAQDESDLVAFFTEQKSLKDVEIEMSDFASNSMLLTVLFCIIDNCREVERLKYCSDLPWLHRLSARELSHVYRKTMNLKMVETDFFRLSSSSSIPTLRIDDVTICEDDEAIDDRLWIVRSLFVSYAHLNDLKLNYGKFSNEILQMIFQFMVQLKRLSIILHAENSSAGFTKHDCGYSIRRLKNLEWLEIILNDEERAVHIDDSIFDEFHFPNLRYLYCFAPKGSEALADAKMEMPALDEIELTSSRWISSESLIKFCRSKKNLRTVRMEESEFNHSIVRKVFEVCPSLKYLHTRHGTDYYDPLTGEVRRVSKYPKK